MIRRVIVAAALLLAAAGAYSAYWMSAADTLRAEIARWAAERRAEGWTVAYDGPEISGFPLALGATIATPHLAVPGWSWHGPTVMASARPWSPGEIALNFPGAHRIEIVGRDRRRVIVAKAGAATGWFRAAADGRIAEAAANLTTVEAGRAGDDATTTAAKVTIRLIPTGSRIAMTITDMLLPPDTRPPLGRAVERIDSLVALQGPIAGQTPHEALMRWRDGGGTMEIEHLRLLWGGLDFSGSGTMALDGAQQPIGAMKARIAGYRALVDALETAGLLRGTDGFVAKLALGMVARATPGGNNIVSLPVTLQDRRLSIGPAKLLRLPAIKWD